MGFDLYGTMAKYQGTEDLGGDPVLNTADAAQVAELVAEKVIAETGAAMEEVVTEVQELTTTIEGVEETVEDLAEEVAGIESLLNGVWNGDRANDKWNKALKLASKLGYEHQGSVLGAESFGDSSTAQLEMHAGLLGFGDSMKKAGGAVVDMVKRIFSAICNFVQGLFDQRKGVINRANALAVRVEKVEKVKEEIKLGKWNNYVGAGESGTSDAAIDAALKLQGILAKMGNTVAAAAKSGDVGPFVTDAKAYISSVIGIGTGSTKDVGKKKQYVGTVVGMRIIASSPKEAKYGSLEEAAATIGQASIAFAPNPDAKIAITGTLKNKETKQSLAKICTDVKSLMDDVGKTKIDNTFSMANRDKIISEIKMTSEKDDAKGATKFATAGYRMVSNGVLAISKFIMNAADARLSYVAACI